MDTLAPSRYVAFIDECGDHSLNKIDQDFPLFLLAMVIVRRDVYRDIILPRLNTLKLAHWPHEGINLHSRDIRKATGHFAILQNPAVRTSFMDNLTDAMTQLPFELLVVAVQKRALQIRYKQADNPYDIALTFMMERLVRWAEKHGESRVPLVAEARGKREDKDLKATFFDLLQQGTPYVTADRFKAMSFPLEFRDKRTNIAGIQLADLCAHPAARHILKPDQPNRAFDAVKPHLADGVQAWKVFP